MFSYVQEVMHGYYKTKFNVLYAYLEFSKVMEFLLNDKFYAVWNNSILHYMLGPSGISCYESLIYDLYQ